MTVEQILFDFAHVEPVKPITRQTLYNYFGKFGIKPMTKGTWPAQYPADAPIRIRIKLGLLPARGASVKPAKLPGVKASKSRH